MGLERLQAWIRRGEPCVLATVVETTGSAPRGAAAKLVWSPGGEMAGSIGGGGVEHLCLEAAAEVLRVGAPTLLRLGLQGGEWVRQPDEAAGEGADATVTVFLEPFLPQAEVVLFGAGHVAQALGRLCAAFGMPYRVYDDRPELLDPAHFPGATETFHGPFETLDPRFGLRGASHCVILTHAHAFDERVLEQLLGRRDLPYVGMIGSGAKVRGTFERLKSKGLDVHDRVYAPIGLALGGREPADIALAILAEIRLVIGGGQPGHRRLPEGMP